jgi:imidazolonepropionase-like amidohydrolase
LIDQRGPRPINEQFERIYWVKRRTVKAFYDAGGGDLITLGTDHPSWGEFVSGFAAHRELHAMVLAGIPPIDAIRIGTINGARALNVSAYLGTIEAGKFADLFVVNGNPLEDIRNTRNVAIAMKAGQVHDATQLLDRVVGTIGPRNAAEEAAWKPAARR